MSRSTRDSVRRRASLLATTSFVAASVLAGAGALTAVMTPSVAMAASECGAVTLGGLLICNPPSTKYTKGITYTAANITNTAGAYLNDINVKDTGGGNNGVTFTSGTAGANLAVQTSWETILGGAASNVDATTKGDGILVSSSKAGDVSINTVDAEILISGGIQVIQNKDLHNTITGAVSGLETITTGAGTSTVIVGADTIKGVTDDGIKATTDDGSNTIWRITSTAK